MAHRLGDWLLGPRAAQRYLLAIVFAAPLATTRLVGAAPLTLNVYELPKTVLVRVLVLAAFATWAAHALRPRGRIRLTGWFAAVGVIVAWTALAAAVSRSPFTSLLGSEARLDGLVATLTYALIAFLSVQVFSAGGDLRPLARTTVVGGLIVAGYALLQTAGLDPAFYFPTVELTTGRVFSTFGNPVFLGGYLLLVLPIAATLGVAEDDPRWRVAAWTAFALAAVAIIPTASRTAWLGAFVEVVLLGVLLARKKVRLGGAALAAAGVTLVAATGYVLNSLRSPNPDANVWTRLTTLFTRPSGSTLERLLIARTAVDATVARPALGYGPDRFVIAFRRFRPAQHVELFPAGNYVDNAHSVPLQVAATSGVVAALAWVAAAAWPLIVSARTAFSEARSPERTLFAGVWVAALGGLVYMLTGISVVGISAIFWLLLGVLAGSKARSIEVRSGVWRVPAVIVAGVLLALALVWGGLLVAADASYMDARLRLAGKRAGDPVAEMRQAIALDPVEPLYRRDLALQLASAHSPEALGAVNAVLRLEPDDAHFLVVKARLLAAGGDTQGAARALQRAQGLAPTDPIVLNALSELTGQPE